MKVLAHLFNIIAWIVFPLVIVFIFSFPLMYSYKSVVQSGGFRFLYVVYNIIMFIGYIISTEDDVETLQFIKTKEL